MARGPDTRANLIEAAIAEFDEHGFEATNSNRIARRAGYAPQTFYRHFADKTAIFLAVYELWYRAHIETVAHAASRREAAKAIVASHRKTLRFRRSLRQLAYAERSVAEARAKSRWAQIERLATGLPDRTHAELAAMLLSVERLADGIAEQEFSDLSISEADALVELSARLVWIGER